MDGGKAMPRAVILSLTTALDEMVIGSLTEDDLKDAIFCLGCTRHFALELSAEAILRNQTYQGEKVTLTEVMRFTKYLEEAERDKRVVWRRLNSMDDISPFVVQAALSTVLSSQRLNSLNPNLPPISENLFLKTAIERVNNKDGIVLVKVIV
jgi:hypothetical protein